LLLRIGVCLYWKTHFQRWSDAPHPVVFRGGMKNDVVNFLVFTMLCSSAVASLSLLLNVAPVTSVIGK
jgi:hypothetical protein